ncbi:DDE-type integrase/transposase/recombinase [Streptomyces sp. NPDC005474]|uniref:DDE-type integrase/transposase/recombinase n=1 Tax=Streptomyces sp. NPDC005474 TaxID=3154878 RepID=UPI003455F4C7
MGAVSPSYKGHRYPVEVISHCVWLYHRFPINGRLQYLWRAVDQDGNTLDILVQGRRDKAAARRFFRRLMKKTRVVPQVVVTDKLRSCGAVHREVMPRVEHRQSTHLKQPGQEFSHRPTRQRERARKGFRSTGAAQRFLSAFSGISPPFRPRRRLMTAAAHRAAMSIRFAIWDQITAVAGLSTTA